MKRHFYVSDDLNDLESVENELEAKGVTKPQMHVLSERDGDVELHNLHEVEAVLKKDVVNRTQVGAIVGIALAALILVAANFLGWTSTAAGWLPFVFLSVVVLGFSTWEGGLIGIQEPHHQFKRFQKMLTKGKHIFFVDVESNQEPALAEVVKQHPKLKEAGTDKATPWFVVRAQDKFHAFMKAMP